MINHESKKRRIAVFSGNRAEYGLLSPILKAIKENDELDYILIISGAHIDENFGQTKEEILKDGFEIDSEVVLNTSCQESTFTPQAISSGIAGLAEILNEKKPDILLVYADRFEGFAAVIAGTQMNIPTAHIEGGDLTEGGALDDSVRHAMTKLSHLHFTTNEQATNRLLAMGEEPWRVTTVGLPALDLIKENDFANEKELRDKLRIGSHQSLILFTQHSVTTEDDQAIQQLNQSLNALKRISEENVRVIITYPNNDAGGSSIVKELEGFKETANENVSIHKSLGRYTYHGVLALARSPIWKIACVGNSSSGIKETPAFGCPTVNIGTRQKSRLRGDNVIDVDYDSEKIYNAIRKCLFDDEFIEICKNTVNPYSKGYASKHITEILSSVNLDPKVILRKRMLLKGYTKEGWFR